MTFTEGAWPAIARQWDWGRTSKGDGEVVVQFEILDGPDTGKRIQWRGYFGEKSRQRTIEGLRYCGWTSDDIMDMEGMGSSVCEIVIGYEEYEGRTYAKVKWVNRAAGIKVSRPMNMADKRKFAAELKLHARQVPIAPGPPPSDRAKTEKVPHDDEDEEGGAPF